MRVPRFTRSLRHAVLCFREHPWASWEDQRAHWILLLLNFLVAARACLAQLSVERCSEPISTLSATAWNCSESGLRIILSILTARARWFLTWSLPELQPMTSKMSALNKTVNSDSINCFEASILFSPASTGSSGAVLREIAGGFPDRATNYPGRVIVKTTEVGF